MAHFPWAVDTSRGACGLASTLGMSELAVLIEFDPVSLGLAVAVTFDGEVSSLLAWEWVELSVESVSFFKSGDESLFAVTFISPIKAPTFGSAVESSFSVVALIELLWPAERVEFIESVSLSAVLLVESSTLGIAVVDKLIKAAAVVEDFKVSDETATSFFTGVETASVGLGGRGVVVVAATVVGEAEELLVIIKAAGTLIVTFLTVALTVETAMTGLEVFVALSSFGRVELSAITSVSFVLVMFLLSAVMVELSCDTPTVELSTWEVEFSKTSDEFSRVALLFSISKVELPAVEFVPIVTAAALVVVRGPGAAVVVDSDATLDLADWGFVVVEGASSTTR